ncbi:hypothetical protein PPTG_23478 [Phytophthora nicotianae INRA-310]|uniref:Uncharacterized protein n=1 Tax=Phytophthora nicotianae (strain INRA-310) TaxID=761204 RepID=W2PXG0_PHYN3|nr:hypothetical protein PPTG_23478 [Phytophthora nicotianae INRA-310]ETN05592.1 hypothetical protein PPTG_23478 [Phytophthora nicotianae INRA-310]
MLFIRRGNVAPKAHIVQKPRWQTECIKFVEHFIDEHTCFYIEELQVVLQSTFPSLQNVSTSYIYDERCDLNSAKLARASLNGLEKCPRRDRQLLQETSTNSPRPRPTGFLG